MATLANAIITQDIDTVRRFARQVRNEINLLDEYGFTPLIESAIVNNIEIAKILLEQHASPNRPDVTGGTPLQWAVENDNISFCELLLQHGADPNAYNFSGQPVLVMPILRQQSALRKCLVNAGADLTFARDYINTKLIGHVFELVGNASIVSPKNEYVEVDFEGFYLEVTLGLIADSLKQFQNHFAARQLRRYARLSDYIVDIISRGAELIRYQQYQVNLNKHRGQIDSIINVDPLLIPVAYEGHAITFIRFGKFWIKCDRREDSRLYDNIMLYQITNQAALTNEFVYNLIYRKNTYSFINDEIDNILGLEPFTEIKVAAQISGNCSWANVEACIPALFFVVLLEINQDAHPLSYYKTLSINFFNRWREWNKNRLLNYCIQAYEAGDALRKASNAEILAAILFQRCHIHETTDRDRIELILSLLLNSPYEYLLRNYLKAYFYERMTEEGKRFAEMLKLYGYQV